MTNKIDRAALEAILAKTKRITKLDLTAVNVQRPEPLDFSGAVIEESTLSNLDLKGVSFRKATITNSNWMNGVNFSGADFTGAKLTGCSWVNLKMAGASFVGATLKKSELSQCDLSRADFTGANLEKADLSFSKLTGARFEGANLAGADFTGAVGYANGGEEGEGEGEAEPTVFETVSSTGGPILAIPAALGPKWKGDPPDAEDVVTVCGWVETGSIPLGSGRALLLAGEMNTGIVRIDGGVVLLRGGGFDEIDDARKAVTKAVKKKTGWKKHAHELEVSGGGLWLWDSSWQGAADRKEIEAEDGVLAVDLPDGRYAVDVAGINGDDGPIVFVRLVRI